MQRCTSNHCRIAKHGRKAGVTFHQSPAATARYPTEAILTAVRMLADNAEADHSPTAADLRAMLDQADPSLPIEIQFPDDETAP